MWEMILRPFLNIFKSIHLLLRVGQILVVLKPSGEGKVIDAVTRSGSFSAKAVESVSARYRNRAVSVLTGGLEICWAGMHVLDLFGSFQIPFGLLDEKFPLQQGAKDIKISDSLLPKLVSEGAGRVVDSCLEQTSEFDKFDFDEFEDEFACYVEARSLNWSSQAPSFDVELNFKGGQALCIYSLRAHDSATRECHNADLKSGIYVFPGTTGKGERSISHSGIIVNRMNSQHHDDQKQETWNKCSQGISYYCPFQGNECQISYGFLFVSVEVKVIPIARVGPALPHLSRQENKQLSSNTILGHFNSGLASQYKEGKNTDVRLSCQGQEFLFYKIVLASFSTVFEAMFNHTGFKESKEGTIDIDGNARALHCLLDLMIYGSPKDVALEELALDVFVLCDKYNISSIKDFCVPYIINSLNRENCLNVLVTSYLHQNETVNNAAFEVLKVNKAVLTSTGEWRSMVKAYPMLINELLIKLM